MTEPVTVDDYIANAFWQKIAELAAAAKAAREEHTAKEEETGDE